MSEIDKKYVPEGVFLVCDKGGLVRQLLANPNTNTNFYGVKACLETDNQYMLNIAPFGPCKTLKQCVFSTVQWTKVKQNNVKINGARPLLEHSEAVCKAGQGKIKIYFDEYEADLANENNNESAFVSESISSNILGHALLSIAIPGGRAIADTYGREFSEGIGRGIKKGMEGTWNFIKDLRKGETWKGMGKSAVIIGSYGTSLGDVSSDAYLSILDGIFKTDFKETKSLMEKGIKKSLINAGEDIKRGNWGEVGETYGQLQYAVAEAAIGSKGAGAILKGIKGAGTALKGLMGAGRLARLLALSARALARIKQGLGVIKVGRFRLGEYLFRNWHKGTFPNRLQSLRYHLSKHGKGRTAIQYTKDAMDFFKKNKKLGKKHILKDGTPGIKIQTKQIIKGKTHRIGGIWTSDGKLVTFWD